jgi:nuclear transport factor 2 (NTF2) superfamily protein
MSAQAAAKHEKQNPRTLEDARAMVKHVESLFMPWNIDALVDGFTEDCVIRFGIMPEFRGKKALHEFFTARSAKQKNYRLRKQNRSLVGDVMTNIWEGEWQDAVTGAPMKGYGVEAWTLHDGKVALWEVAFNVARADQTVGVTAMLDQARV